ncbi:MAG: protease inhibitor I42 family protein [Dehalogenimonas sp.]
MEHRGFKTLLATIFAFSLVACVAPQPITMTPGTTTPGNTSITSSPPTSINPPTTTPSPTTTPPPTTFTLPTITTHITGLTVTAEDMGADHFDSARLLISEISVARGETIVLTMYSLSGSFPAIWHFVPDSSGIIEQQGEREFIPDWFPTGGGAGPIPGNEKWIFKAMKAGETTLTMNFRTRSDIPVTIVTFNLRITVS